jgi:RNase H-fold protein (predicted Holliday junction resolvase)
VAILTQKFILELKNITNLPIETVEESVSTIEASAIQKINKGSIDSTSAAVILRRVIS